MPSLKAESWEKVWLLSSLSEECLPLFFLIASPNFHTSKFSFF